MKRFLVLALALAIAIAAFLVLRPKAPASIDASSAKKAPSKKRLGDLRAQVPRPRTTQPAPVSGAAECSEPWRSLLETDFNGFTNAILAEKTGRSPACQAWEKAHWPKALGPYPEQCFTVAAARGYADEVARSGKETKTVNHPCTQPYVFYRAWAMQQATAGQPYDDLSPTLLANKILARFFDMANDPKAKQDISEMANALKKKEPDMLAPYKVDLIMEFMSDPPDWDCVQTSLIEMKRRFDTVDVEVQSAELVAMSKRTDIESKEILEQLEEYAVQSPKDSRWDYFRGAFQWKAGDGKAALNFVQRALKADPQNATYKQTIANMQKNKPGTPKVFSLSLGFNFDQL